MRLSSVSRLSHSVVRLSYVTKFRHFGVTQQSYDGVVSYELNDGGIPDDK